MSRQPFTRRRFLTLSLALLLAPAALRWDRARAAAESRRATYALDAGILYGMLNYHLDGTLTESVDRVGGRYDVTIVGEGDGIANRIESSGALREGRWAPREPLIDEGPCGVADGPHCGRGSQEQPGCGCRGHAVTAEN